MGTARQLRPQGVDLAVGVGEVDKPYRRVQGGKDGLTAARRRVASSRLTALNLFILEDKDHHGVAPRATPSMQFLSF
jgi:hypothetical protein